MLALFRRKFHRRRRKQKQLVKDIEDHMVQALVADGMEEEQLVIDLVSALGHLSVEHFGKGLNIYFGNI